MFKAKVYNEEGKVIAEENLEPAIFGLKPKIELIQQAVVTQEANGRQSVAHTKTRGEVRGGGRKPWKQKGTGRARHGSIRSPIWIGGGVTFGPRKDRNFSVKMNKKARRKALFMCFSQKAIDQKIVLLEKLAVPQIKTKKMVAILAKLPVKKTILLALPKIDQNIIKSGANLPYLKTIMANSLNVVDVLKHEYLLMPKESLKVIKDTYLRDKKV